MERLLVCSLGNTNIHWGIFADTALIAAGSLPADGPWALPHGEWQGVARAVYASVNREAAANWTATWRANCDLPLVHVGVDLPIPIRCAGPDPSQVGADRLLNALAWRRRSTRAAVIVDFGTAVTIDVISERGEFCGGVICPGPELLARSLSSGTSLLPSVEILPTEHLFGRDTGSAIRRGVFGMLIGGVAYHIAEMTRRLAPDTAVVATGGGAARYAAWCEGIEVILPHLTLDGLRIAAESAVAA